MESALRFRGFAGRGAREGLKNCRFAARGAIVLKRGARFRRGRVGNTGVGEKGFHAETRRRGEENKSKGFLRAFASPRELFRFSVSFR
jgi:hypothetical protein